MGKFKNKKKVSKPVDNAPLTRKSIRKEKRKQKKINKLQHYNNKKCEPGKFVKINPNNNIDTVPNLVKPKKKKSLTQMDIAERERKQEKEQDKKLQTKMEEQRKQMLLKENEHEDKIIKKLGKQLKLFKMKSKNVTKMFAPDGLDYILEVCDSSAQAQIVAAEKHLADVDAGSDFENDIAIAAGQPINEEERNQDDESEEDEEGSKDNSLADSLSDNGSSSDQYEPVKSTKESRFFKPEYTLKRPLDTIEEIDGNSTPESDEESPDTQESNADIMSDNELRNLYSGQDKKAIKRKIVVSHSTVSANKKPKAAINSNINLNGIHVKRKLSESAGEMEESAEEVLESFGSEDDIEDGGAKTQDAPKPDVWEDIYGRKRDRLGNIIKEEQGAYVPPHLRTKELNTESQEIVQLKRQIKGVLNKLAGGNLHWASTTIEALYSSNSRNAGSSALCQIWLSATVQVSATPERLLAEHAALIAILQANVGSEIGAYFLQVLVKKFDEMMKVEQPMASKLLDNLVAVLAHLYSFKIYHASLLYQIMEMLLKNITEKNIECVLAVLRTVGGALRKEEPMALREFIHNTQLKVGDVNMKAAVGSRIKFLLDVLLAVKNNNLNKIPNYDPSYTEQLLKVIKTIIRRGNYTTTLKIGLEDLLKVEERGKWWVVGSAWQGREVRAHEQVGEPAKGTVSVDQRLLDLARQQRMNTDIRRDIFCIIMSAEDYMNAFEKLQHLGLKNQQEREIVSVMLACCLQEKNYNPYYAVLAQKFCDYDRKYQLSIQYAVWDKIKDLESFNQQQMSNLAQFLTHLFMEKGLPLSVLKIIEFADLNKSSVRFMRQILVSILIHDDVQMSQDVFQRITGAPKLQPFREKLKLFLEHFLLRNTNTKFKVLSKSQVTLLKDRIALMHKIL